VVSFAPQPVITEDNLVVHIDTVLYFQVTDPRAATYEIANFIQALEQLTVTTLRNVIGGMDLERTLTSREEINGQLRGVLDEATGKWGIRVNRVELKGYRSAEVDHRCDGEAAAGRAGQAGDDPDLPKACASHRSSRPKVPSSPRS
jgi:regulator of protease activity HflC (stomatin/prohibitin superfamily)